MDYYYYNLPAVVSSVLQVKLVTMATDVGSPQRFFHMPRFQHQAPRQVFYKRPDFAQQQAMQQLTFDGKRMRKAVNRKTIDYNPSVIRYLEVPDLRTASGPPRCPLTRLCPSPFRTACGSAITGTSGPSNPTPAATTT